jgi:hypothetical protein
MKSAVAIAVVALIAALPIRVSAASGLRDLMHVWRAHARSIRDELNGRYDETALRADFQGYVADAGQIVARVKPRTAEARDFKARFAAFQADAQTALGDVASGSALANDYLRLMNDCQACHHLYRD